MKKIYSLLFCIFSLISANVIAQCTTNYLVNPSFEAPVQPLLNSNNFPAPYNVFGGWNIPSSTAGVPVGGFNIIKVNGTGYSGGPNTAHAGNQYVDINGAGGYVQQSFGVTCGSTIEFSGWFSRREPGGAGFTGYMDIIDGSNNIITSSSTVNFTASESEEVWKQVVGIPVAVVAGTYTLRFFMDDYANIDDAFLCVSPGCILATNISNFSAATNACNANLSWIASNTSDTKNYEIQTSADGTTFKTIETIPSAGTNNYAYQSKNETGKVFYRLKINDRNNTFSYSKIVPVFINCDNVLVNVFPNPTSDIVHVNINSKLSNKAILCNMEGKNMSTTNLQNGDNIIDIKSLPKGVYILKVINELDSKIFRVSKL
jgi:Secretion system C-terminal sorting domain